MQSLQVAWCVAKVLPSFLEKMWLLSAHNVCPDFQILSTHKSMSLLPVHVVWVYCLSMLCELIACPCFAHMRVYVGKC